MNKRLRVAVGGGGAQHIGPFQQLPDQFEVLAICDIDAAKAGTLATSMEIARVTTDLAELCRMDDLDVISICTSPHLHFEQIQQVLEAGKHALHAHDMLSYILGPIKNVFARTATRIHAIEVEDCASVSLEMADGSLASLSVTLGSSPEITRHRFCFQNLTAESNTQPYHNSFEPWTFTGDTPELSEQIAAALSRFVPLPERFSGQFYRLYQALQDGTELPVTLADARAALELITAMYHSSREEQSVALPIGRDRPAYASWLPPDAQ